MSALGVAAKRATEIGAATAAEDKRVRELMRQAASHLLTAVRDEPKPQSDKLRNLTLLGVVAGATYITRKIRSGSAAT